MTKYLRLTPVPGENPIERFVAEARDAVEWVETVSEVTVFTITDAKSIKAKLSGSKIGATRVAAGLTGRLKETGLSGLLDCPVSDTPK
jgi:hypothetical protein